jgi:TolB-like protein
MQLLTELKRRNVFRVAAAYAFTAWLVLQVADILLNNFGAPDWVFRTLAILFLIGFPVALVFSWAFEITPEGIKREQEVPSGQSITPVTGRRLDQATIVMVVLALVVLAADRLWLERDGARVDVGDPVAMSPANAASAATRDLSIAVLPFVDMSPDKDQEYFSDGLSEEILNLLAQIQDLRVIGRTSSFAFKDRNVDLREIGGALGVSHLLEGSVRKDGDDLRITAQLIQVDDGSHLWSQSYDRQLESVFAIQTEIASAIADALRVSLVAPEDMAPVTRSAASMPAYELFLQARRLIQGRSEVEAARDLLDEAIELDPDYAPAYAAAAQAVVLMASAPGAPGNIPLDQATATAQPLIDRALALDPQLAEAHAVQGLLYELQGDIARSDAALARALELNPSLSDALNWRTLNLERAGRLREALAARQRLAAIDPLNHTNLSNLAGLLGASGASAEANALAQHIQRAFPDSPLGFMRQAQVLTASGRLAEARVLAERALAMTDSPHVQRALFVVFGALGDFDRLLALQAVNQGLALLGLGRIDEALAAARAQDAAAPGYSLTSYLLLRTLSWAGRHDEVLAVYRGRWRNLEGIEAAFGFYLAPSAAASIAAAQRVLGQHEELAETLQHWGEWLAFMREQGFAHSRFHYTEAGHLALGGKHKEALAALAEAIDLGYRNPLFGIDPTFAELRDDPDFQAQVARVIKLINIERAKLDMEPLP